MCFNIRGCSQIMSAKMEGSRPPPPFFQTLSAFLQSALPSLSAIVSISPNPPSSLCQLCQRLPNPPPPLPFPGQFCQKYLMPPSSRITFFFWKKVHYLTEIITMLNVLMFCWANFLTFYWPIIIQIDTNCFGSSVN